MTVPLIISGATVSITGGPAATLVSVGSTASKRGDVVTVPALNGHAMRCTAGHVRLEPAADFSAGNFTVEAWVSTPRVSRHRTIVSRSNGNTEISLSIDTQGFPVAVVASASGGYRTTLRGTSRVDDGKWHQIAVTSQRGGMLLPVWDQVLVVDGQSTRTGRINPGLFGSSPVFTMITPIDVGGLAGSNLIGGDVLAVSGRRSAESVATLATRWARRPVASRTASGWGIVVS